MNYREPDLQVSFGPLKLKNPVVTASGTFGYGREYAEIVDPNLLGGIVVKGLSLKPRPGNSAPRIVETPAGMLNAIGLENIGRYSRHGKYLRPQYRRIWRGGSSVEGRRRGGGPGDKRLVP